ncbi:xanthine dehydrogenase family protein molybdopterin-binding subunit [Burkholderia sp. Ac-20379]|uniref:xanthine dehydrogenase family protein molybdopterin-binding subunit n=1 Tax=Burkholderia sp. Ac-20379 TaxID=2703900 RepID=UPI00197DCFCB|nr:molybdopterin cofactor-binding domain-containing protein [Burkholderia sp. Ac-20379]MBN3724617.1 xanthine dehydrogenase family protein molybdopterin-binding subunit [Burkholderia sp. Ac-20379]
MHAPEPLTSSRRDFLKQGAALIVGFSLARPSFANSATLPSGSAEIAAEGALPAAVPKTVDAARVDAFLALGDDGMLSLYTGKVNLGTGNTTALAQMVVEELEFPIGQVRVVQGDTALTVDQGPTNGSMSVQAAGIQLRQAAATAAAAIRDVASKAWRVPPASVRLANGRAYRDTRDKNGTAYHALLANRPLELALDPHAPLKPVSQYRVVGQPVPRDDVRAKVFAEFEFMQDVRVDGMVHARVIHPNAYGAQLLSFDDGPARAVPGFLQTVRIGNLLAAIATSEWAAIRASRAIVARWSRWTGLPDEAKLFDAVRALPVHEQGTLASRGDPAAAIAESDAKRTVHATYGWPMQTHGSIGPSCAIGDWRNGKLTVWSSTQAPHMTRDQIAAMMGLPKQDVRLIYVEGAGCYGRNGHEDATAEAALLSRAIDRPVRLQWMREDEHGWDPKGAAVVSELAGALDENGRITAWQYTTWVPYRVSGNADVPLLAAELMRSSPMEGEPDNAGGMEFNMVAPYDVPNMRVTVNRTTRTPLRPSWLRGPGRVQHTYANESFMDELSVAAKADPIEFRLRHFSDWRAQAVLHAVERRTGWQRRPLHALKPSGDVVTGRGMACVRYEPNHAYVASVVEIELDRRTGVVVIKKVTIAHDCGLVVNPDGVRNQVEGEIVQTLSRTMFEQVHFTRSAVTSVDWLTYRLLKFPELPETVDVVLLDRPDQPPVGAGEPTCAVIPSAVASAIQDATGVRPRAIPFTPANLLALLNA